MAEAPLAPLVEAIPIPSEQEAGVANATSTVASPTISNLLHAIPDTLGAAQSLEAANVEEAGPSRRPKEPVEEHIIPPRMSGRVVTLYVSTQTSRRGEGRP